MSIEMKWMIKHDSGAVADDAKKFEAYFPRKYGTDMDNIEVDEVTEGDYICIELGGKKEVFKVKMTPNMASTGTLIHISKNCFKDVNDGSPCSYIKVGAWKFERHLIARDLTTQIVYGGFILGVIPLVIEGLFKIGEMGYVIYPTPKPFNTTILALCSVAKVLGLVLLLRKAIIDRK